MSLRDILFCVVLPFLPAVNCHAIIENPYGIFLGIENDAQDYAAPKVHHPVLECPPSEPEKRIERAGACCLDTFPRLWRGPTRQPDDSSRRNWSSLPGINPHCLWYSFDPRAKARGNSARDNSNSKNVILRFVRPVLPRSPDDRDNEKAPSCLEGIPRYAWNDIPRQEGFFSRKGGLE